MVSPSLTVKDTNMSDIFFEYTFGFCDVLSSGDEKLSTL